MNIIYEIFQNKFYFTTFFYGLLIVYICHSILYTISKSANNNNNIFSEYFKLRIRSTYIEGEKHLQDINASTSKKSSNKKYSVVNEPVNTFSNIIYLFIPYIALKKDYGFYNFLFLGLGSYLMHSLGSNFCIDLDILGMYHGIIYIFYNLIGLNNYFIIILFTLFFFVDHLKKSLEKNDTTNIFKWDVSVAYLVCYRFAFHVASGLLFIFNYFNFNKLDNFKNIIICLIFNILILTLLNFMQKDKLKKLSKKRDNYFEYNRPQIILILKIILANLYIGYFKTNKNIKLMDSVLSVLFIAIALLFQEEKILFIRKKLNIENFDSHGLWHLFSAICLAFAYKETN